MVYKVNDTTCISLHMCLRVFIPVLTTETITEIPEIPTKQLPAETTELPTVAPGAPAETTAQPTVPPEAPEETTEPPAVPTEEPAKNTEAPAVPTEEPAKNTEAPAVPTEEPAKNTEAPAVPTEEPAKYTEAPAEATENTRKMESWSANSKYIFVSIDVWFSLFRFVSTYFILSKHRTSHINSHMIPFMETVSLTEYSRMISDQIYIKIILHTKIPILMERTSRDRLTCMI